MPSPEGASGRAMPAPTTHPIIIMVIENYGIQCRACFFLVFLILKRRCPMHIQTQSEWEQTMARRVMEQLRGELYLDQRYSTAALGPPSPQAGGGCFCHRWRSALLPHRGCWTPTAKTAGICCGRICTACSTACSATCGCGPGATPTCGGWPATLPWRARWMPLNTPRHQAACRLGAPAVLHPVAGLLQAAGRRTHLPRFNADRRRDAEPVAAGVSHRQPPPVARRPGQPPPPRCAASSGRIWAARPS